jgi:hypothetical protein
MDNAADLTTWLTSQAVAALRAGELSATTRCADLGDALETC